MEKSNHDFDEVIQDIAQIVSQMNELVEIAYDRYKPLADAIINGKIDDPVEITHIMDYMLDFCGFNKMLAVYKSVCKNLIVKTLL
jgi:predicted KAP-like P-loop ATPase